MTKNQTELIKIKLNNPLTCFNELEEVLSKTVWEETYVLASNGNVIFLLKGSESLSIRICPDKSELIPALTLLKNGKDFKLVSIESEIKNIQSSSFQLDAKRLKEAGNVSLQEVSKLFQVAICKQRENITTPTARKVFEESHGRCMFVGCGELLTKDYLTCNSGNFAYLAHIIAAKSDGPRGDEIESPRLANCAENIMYLCDKHHRLIDKVALAEYSTQILREMRQEFVCNVEKFLDYLKLESLYTFGAFWPIGNTVPSQPSTKEVAESLRIIRAKEYGNLRQIRTSHDCKTSDANWWINSVPQDLEYVINDFRHGTKEFTEQAALFSIGPMPILIAFGAKIGNKNNVKIIPRSRESGWGWSRKFPNNRFIVEGLKALNGPEEQVNLKFYLTDFPSENLPTCKDSVFPTIIVKANSIGNDCISTPEIGDNLLKEMNDLFTKLKRDHKVKRIHLFPCASNVACIQLGRAMEHNHSDFTIYDFLNEQSGKRFIARLNISMSGDKAQVSGV